MQGKAAVHDLVHSPEVTQVIAADARLDELHAFVAGLKTDKVKPVAINATNLEQVAGLMQQVDAVITLLLPSLTKPLCAVAVANGCHWVDASYAHPEYRALDEKAAEKGLAILPEMGLDPGIDLVMAAAAMGELDEVHELYSYGSGIPEAKAADNPLRYKISWTFAGVLRAYNRPARLIQNGRAVDIPAREIFAPQNMHMVQVDGVGEVEAYPNGDALKYVKQLGLEGQVVSAGRYTMRWPGHTALWKTLSDLGLLGEEPIQVGDVQVVPQRFLHDLLLPQLQYGEGERDLAIVRVDARGVKDGRPKQVIYELVDRRDLETGLLAMQRTVGFTASIGAQMLLRGDIQKRGLLSPLKDVPVNRFFEALRNRGIIVERTAV